MQKNTSNPTDAWELLQVGIKSKSIEFSKKETIPYKKHEKDRENELKRLNELLIHTPHNNDLVGRIELVKKEGEINELYKAKGAQVRSRIKWIKEGEKNTKIFP